MIIEAYIEFYNEYKKFTNNKGGVISFRNFVHLMTSATPSPSASLRTPPSHASADFSKFPALPRRHTYPAETPAAASSSSLAAVLAQPRQEEARDSEEKEGSPVHVAEELEEKAEAAEAEDLEEAETLFGSASAPLPQEVTDRRAVLRHTVSLPVRLNGTVSAFPEDNLRIKYKILASIHKTIKNKILPLHDAIINFNLAYTDQEVKKVEDFFKDLTFTLKNLRAKDSIIYHQGYPGEWIHSHYVILFNTAYMPRVEKLYKIALEKLSGDKERTLQLMELYNNLGLRYNGTGFSLLFSQTMHNAHFSDKGNPSTARKAITQVACELRNNTIKPDSLPLSVFVGVLANNLTLFVKNNRTFTAFSKARVFPERVIPILPTTEESKRPGELVAIKTYGPGEAIRQERRQLELMPSSASSPAMEMKIEEVEEEEDITPRLSY